MPSPAIENRSSDPALVSVLIYRDALHFLFFKCVSKLLRSHTYFPDGGKKSSAQSVCKSPSPYLFLSTVHSGIYGFLLVNPLATAAAAERDKPTKILWSHYGHGARGLLFLVSVYSAIDATSSLLYSFPFHCLFRLKWIAIEHAKKKHPHTLTNQSR